MGTHALSCSYDAGSWRHIGNGQRVPSDQGRAPMHLSSQPSGHATVAVRRIPGFWCWFWRRSRGRSRTPNGGRVAAVSGAAVSTGLGSSRASRTNDYACWRPAPCPPIDASRSTDRNYLIARCLDAPCGSRRSECRAPNASRVRAPRSSPDRSRLPCRRAVDSSAQRRGRDRG